MLEEWIHVDVSQLSDMSPWRKSVHHGEEDGGDGDGDTIPMTRSPAHGVASSALKHESGSKRFFNLRNALHLIGTRVAGRVSSQLGKGSVAQSARQSGESDQCSACQGFDLHVVYSESKWSYQTDAVQNNILRLYLSAAHDGNGAVRAAAVRALGIISVFSSVAALPCYRQFLADVVSIFIRLLDPKNESVLMVRLRVSWAVANLCDQSWLSHNIPAPATCPFVHHVVSRELYIALINATLVATRGKPLC